MRASSNRTNRERGLSRCRTVNQVFSPFKALRRRYNGNANDNQHGTVVRSPLGSHMMSPLEKMRAEALKLGSKERAFLAKCLIESLDQAEEQEIEQLWLDEAERRLAAYQKGTIPAKSASEVFAQAYEKIK